MKLSFVYVTVTIIMTSSISAQNENITVDVRIISSYIKQVMEDILGVDIMQESVEKLKFETMQRKGWKVVNQLAVEVSDTMKKTFEIVLNLKEAVEASLRKKNGKQWIPCCKYTQSQLKQNDAFLSEKVDLDGMCEIIAPSAPKRLQSVGNSVFETMKSNREILPSLKWQFIASSRGILTVYPAQEIQQCQFIDPRFRSWYIESSRSIKRNVLVLLDISRSMNEQYNSVPLINISRNAVDIILRTLTPSDRVGVVAFNSEAFRPSECLENQLALATTKNLKRIREKFLDLLQPRGESVYTVGFRDAFNLLHASLMNRTDAANKTAADWSIQFITDGIPKEIYSDLTRVYETIKLGNKKIGNKASIFSYGIGRNVDMDILSKISSQDFGDLLLADDVTSAIFPPKHGKAFLIKEPGSLQNVISQYNEKREDNTATHPAVTSPYIDGGGLGLTITVGLPVIRDDMSLFGVVAADLNVKELFKDAIYLNNSQDSYLFVIDTSARVIIHPLMPHPTNHHQSASFVRINQLERMEEFRYVMESMVGKGEGERTMVKEQVLPVGGTINTFKITATYFWRPIDGTDYSICFVQKSNSSIRILPQQSILPRIKNRKSIFRYHRLEFENDSPDLCRRFYRKSTTSQTLIVMAPRSYREHFRYPERETVELLQSFQKFFYNLCEASTEMELNSLLQSYSDVADYFVDGVISDIMWTSLADALWVNHTDDHVSLRFIATWSGVDRFYPGSMIPTGFDATARVWYQLAVTKPDLYCISTPYEDAAGAGNVISMSKAIIFPSAINQTQSGAVSNILGVMGLDFSLDHFYSKLQRLYPDCQLRSRSTGLYCVLIDSRGNIILHADYLDKNYDDKSIQHIAGDKQLISLLMKLNFASRKRCLDLKKKVYRVWYELDPSTNLNETSSETINDCARFFMREIPGTNVFFLARRNRAACYVNQCPSQENSCRNIAEDGTLSSHELECPCTYPAQFDSCSDNMKLEDGIAPCFPDQIPLQDKTECNPQHLPQCFDPQCKSMSNASSCSAVVGCAWCNEDIAGGRLALPYCSPNEKCYDGRQGNHLPHYDEAIICPLVREQLSTAQVIAICVACCILLIALLASCIILVKRRKRQKQLNEKEWEDSSPRTSVDMDHDRPLPPSNPAPPDVDSSPKTGHKNHNDLRKQSNAPRVIITVVDSDGSEILSKPVQLVHGGKTYGAPAPAVVRKEQIKRRRSNSTPMLQFRRKKRRSRERSSSSSNNETGLHSDCNGQPTSVSTETTNLSMPASSIDRHKRSKSVDIRLSSSEAQQEDHSCNQAHRMENSWRSRDHQQQTLPQQSEQSLPKDALHLAEPSYLPMRSFSFDNIADEGDNTAIKSFAQTSICNGSNPTLLHSTPDCLRPSHHYIPHPVKNKESVTRQRSFNNPNYESFADAQQVALNSAVASDEAKVKENDTSLY